VERVEKTLTPALQ